MSLVSTIYTDNTAKVKKLRGDAILPTHGSFLSAGYDLHAAIDEPIEIAPQRCMKIGTGLAIACPHGYYGAIVPRSGMGINRGLRPANTPATIDEDYTGEWIVGLYNDSNEVQVINPGDRIAQVIFIPYLKVEWDEVEELAETERGTGGFGSTGR